MELSNGSLFSRVLFAFTLYLLIGLTSDAMAVNFTWTGATSMDWNTETNWNPSYGYPVAPGDTAIFPQNAKNYNISVFSKYGDSPIVINVSST